MEDINPVVLESAVAVLCGGFNQNGTPLIVFPPDAADLADIYAIDDILGVLKEYVHLAGGEVAIVADLRHDWSEDCVSKLTTILDRLQTQVKGCIKVAYFIKPCVRTKKRLFQRHTSWQPEPFQTLPFQVLRMETLDEVYTHVDPAQLPADYGGSLQYNHGAWVQFYKKYVLVLRAAEKLSTELPEIKEETRNLEKTSTNSDDDFVVLMTKMKAKQKAILGHYSMHETVTRCQKALEVLQQPESDPTLQQIQPSLLRDITRKIQAICEAIEQAITDLDKLLDIKETEYDLIKTIDECRRNSKEVVETILLMSHKLAGLPRIAGDAIEAQEYRNEFIADVLEPSKDIVACATAILQELATSRDTTPKTYKASFEIARQLTESLQPFSAQINQLNETYTRIHMFYVIYNKVVRWKEKASKFIAEYLIPFDDMVLFESQSTFLDMNNPKFTSKNDNHFHQNKSNKGGGKVNCELHRNIVQPLCDKTVSAPSGWDRALEYFYYKHPPPRRKHLRLITKFVSDFLEKPQLVDAETLAERTMFILAFLTKRSFKGEDIVRILQWRDRNMSSHDTAVSSSTDITSV